MTQISAQTRHGGFHVAETLQLYGIDEIFTLSGAHIFPIYDACRDMGIKMYDVRHEQTAAFAAEATAKLLRRPGVAALTAGPGVTNAVSAVASAQANGSPVVVLGGRAPTTRWGLGSLQEFDHVPLLAPVTKAATTAFAVEKLSATLGDLIDRALSPHRGPVFLDIPADVLNTEAPLNLADPSPSLAPLPDEKDLQTARELLVTAQRPAILAGSDVWWNGAWDSLRVAAEHLAIPTFTNGMGRGCLSADSPLFFSRSRHLLKTADVVAIVGTPLDFRVSYGRLGAAQVIHVVDAIDQRRVAEPAAVTLSGDLGRCLDYLADGPAIVPSSRKEWLDGLRAEEASKRQAYQVEMDTDRTPIHPARIYGELLTRLDKDAIIIGDGGDFVSYAGRFLPSYEPGVWLDTGPFGCLGSGFGYAMAARLAYPDRQIVLLLGDGAFGFAGMEIDTLVRHGLGVTMIMGNNGIWGLEKHPMQARYGYDVLADLQPGCRYDVLATSLGAAGELVERSSDVGPAIERALSSDAPYLVNVLTDPTVAYPRSAF